MSRIKSNTLPHSLYKTLKREIAMRGGRIAVLERDLELAHERKAQHVEALNDALELARADRTSLTAEVQALRWTNGEVNKRIGRQNVELDALHMRAERESKALSVWRAIGTIGIVLAITTAVIELVGRVV